MRGRNDRVMWQPGGTVAAHAPATSAAERTPHPDPLPQGERGRWTAGARQGMEETDPDAPGGPADIAVAERLAWPVVGRRIDPAPAGLQDMDDVADHPAVVNTRLATRLGNVLQVFLPSLSQDQWINGKPITMMPFPDPGSLDAGRYGRPGAKVEHLTDREPVKGEKVPAASGFDAVAHRARRGGVITHVELMVLLTPI